MDDPSVFEIACSNPNAISNNPDGRSHDYFQFAKGLHVISNNPDGRSLLHFEFARNLE